MEANDLDNHILVLYKKMNAELSEDQKKNIHFKSVSNFIYHLVEHQTLNKKRNIKLQESGEIRMKNKLLEYLKLIKEHKDSSKDESLLLYNDYLHPIGRLMAEYYSFSITGGMKFLILLIFILIGGFLDIVSYLLFTISFPIFISSLLLISIIRMYIKHKQRRVYGAFY